MHSALDRGVHGDAANFAENVGEGGWIEPNVTKIVDRAHLGTKLHAAVVCTRRGLVLFLMLDSCCLFLKNDTPLTGDPVGSTCRV